MTVGDYKQASDFEFYEQFLSSSSSLYSPPLLFLKSYIFLPKLCRFQKKIISKVYSSNSPSNSHKNSSATQELQDFVIKDRRIKLYRVILSKTVIKRCGRSPFKSTGCDRSPFKSIGCDCSPVKSIESHCTRKSVGVYLVALKSSVVIDFIEKKSTSTQRCVGLDVG